MPTSRKAMWTALIATALLMRSIALGRLPGINGDEAWYGVNVYEFLSGGTPFFHTGVGNLLSPIHSGLLLALSTAFPASPALLRVPEVILGMLAVLLAYPLLRRPLGQRAALLTTALLAVSPTAVIYARLGWDPSGSPLFTLLAIAAALHDRPMLALIAMMLGYTVHPTNIFVAPMVLAAWMPHALDRYRKTTAANRARLVRGAIVAIVLMIPLVTLALVRIAANPETPLPSVGMALTRLFSPAQWIGRAWGVLGLLSGTSAAIDVAGPRAASATIVPTTICGLLLVVAIALSSTTLRAHRHAVWLLGGLAVTFAGFHIVAIEPALNPGLERYALFLLVPLLLVCAIAVAALTERSLMLGYVAAATIAGSMLFVALAGYFAPLQFRGGDSATTYRTSDVEPKLSAFRFVENDGAGGPVTIVAEDWWLYWTLRYFATVDPRIHVEPAPGASIPGGTRPAGAPERVVPHAAKKYLVVFAGSGLPSSMGATRALFTAIDPIARPILQVYAVDPP